jgi:hypothetical protein
MPKQCQRANYLHKAGFYRLNMYFKLRGHIDAVKTISK